MEMGEWRGDLEGGEKYPKGEVDRCGNKVNNPESTSIRQRGVLSEQPIKRAIR